jgi:hypothetical protein
MILFEKKKGKEKKGGNEENKGGVDEGIESICHQRYVGGVAFA